jgi:hypothetical protein
MDLRDGELDSFIGLALQPAAITSQQKQLAWERLHQRAAAQSVLPPVVAARPWWVAVLQGVRRSVYQFFMEERRYEQAQSGRRSFEYTSRAIDSARLAAEVMGPIRFSVMYQMG